jgi:hypothetical protein
MVRGSNHSPWNTNVLLPTKVEEFQATSQTLEQKRLWEYIPSSKKYGVENEGNTIENHSSG